METMNSKIEGDVIIDYDLRITGIVTGNITVGAGGCVELNGICGEDLIIETDAEVYLRGTVGRNVYNRGGKLEVYGVISGSLFTETGNTIVDKKAMIRGR